MAVVEPRNPVRRAGQYAASGLLLCLLQGCQMFGLFEEPPPPDPH